MRQSAGPRQTPQGRSAGTAGRVGRSVRRGHRVPADVGGRLAEQWQTGQGGAWAGRGFHFQDAVGALLAAKVTAGSIRAEAVVPEGLEDASLEGDDPRHVQVKSRGDHLGPFPSSEAIRHIVDAWTRHIERGQPDAGLVVVLERGVGGEPPLNNWDVTLAESLPDDSNLRRRLAAESARRGIAAPEADSLLSSTVLVVVCWDEVVAETVSLLGGLVDIPPAGLVSVAHQLRVVVADAADCNASLGNEDRRRLSATELVGTIERSAELVDSKWLNAAIRDGTGRRSQRSPSGS